MSQQETTSVEARISVLAAEVARLRAALADVLEPQTDWDLEQAMARARKVLDNAD